ncbi:MAG: TerD family protein, partial [Desulfovibrio sp.]|nr:TerD family protein [Desulfovibrio sp.]
VVYFGQLRSKDGAVVHSGDNLTGDGEGDDEVIAVDLKALPSKVHYLVFTISSYQGQSFDEIKNAFCRLVDETSKTELASFTITGGGDYTGMIMAALYRGKEGGWKMRAIGEKARAKTVQDLFAPIVRIL